MTPEQTRIAFENQVIGELVGVLLIVFVGMLAWRYWDRMTESGEIVPFRSGRYNPAPGEPDYMGPPQVKPLPPPAPPAKRNPIQPVEIRLVKR